MCFVKHGIIMRFRRGKLFIIIVMILLLSPYFKASANPIGTISISLEGEVKEININQSDRPLIIHGSVGYEGVSVRPVTITLDPICDVGDVILTQYEFVFHVPDTIPFDALIFIYPETENDTVGTLILNSYFSVGVIQQNGNPVAQIFTVLNYDENEEIIESVIYRIEPQNYFLIGIPALMSTIGTAIIFIIIKKKRG